MNRRTDVCGFSFGKNLTKLNYPVEASINSVLPLCDRFIFAVGESEDDTRQRVAAVSPKVEIVDTVWPDVQVDGTVLAIEANKAMSAAENTGCTWGFYIQADEVVHEADHPTIQDALACYAEEPQVKALLFRYLHFMLDYQTVDPWMYHKACRIVRLDKTCRIFGDACGPGLQSYTGKINNGYLDKRHLGGYVRWACSKDTSLLTRRPRIYHYGWVKTRQELDVKLEMVEKLWWGTLENEEMAKRKDNKFGNFMGRYPILKNYHGSHPSSMGPLVSAHPPYAAKRNRWSNPRFYAEVLRHGFHG